VGAVGAVAGLVFFEGLGFRGFVHVRLFPFLFGFQARLIFEALAEFLVVEHFKAPVLVFHDGCERLHPVAGIEVVDIAQRLIIGRVDVSADDAAALTLASQVFQLLLVFADEADGALDLGFDRLAQGEVFLAAPCSVAVINPVDSKQALVADISKHCQPLMVDGDCVKPVSVHDEVVAPGAFVDVFFEDFNLAEEERQATSEKVIVVAAQIDDLRVPLLDFFEHQTNKSRMRICPTSSAGEAPAIDDITIQDQLLAVGVLEEVVYLINFTIECAQMHI